MKRRAGSESGLSLAHAWYLAFIVFLAYVIGQVDRQVIVMLAADMKRSLFFSDEQLGLLMGLAFSATYAVGALFFAYLADRSTRKRVLLIGIVVWSVATTACAFMKSFHGLLIARLLVGFGEGALAPAALPMIAAAFSPERRSFPIAFCLAGTSVGMILTPVATGWLLGVMSGRGFGPFPVIGVLYGWQTAFFMAGAAGLLVVMLLLGFREPLDGRPRDEAVRRPPGEAFSYFRRRARFYLAVFAAVPIGVAPAFALVAWIPIYLEREFDMVAEQIGAMFAAAFAPALVLGPVLGGLLGQYATRMSDKRGYFSILLVLILMGSIAMALPMLMPTAASLIVAFTIVVLYSHVTMTLGLINSQQLVPDRFRGQGTAILMTAQMIVGAGVGPYAVGFFATRIVGEGALYQAQLLVIMFTAPVAMAILLLARRDRSGMDLTDNEETNVPTPVGGRPRRQRSS